MSSRLLNSLGRSTLSEMRLKRRAHSISILAQHKKTLLGQHLFAMFHEQRRDGCVHHTPADLDRIAQPGKTGPGHGASCTSSTKRGCSDPDWWKAPVTYPIERSQQMHSDTSQREGVRVDTALCVKSDIQCESKLPEAAVVFSSTHNCSKV